MGNAIINRGVPFASGQKGEISKRLFFGSFFVFLVAVSTWAILSWSFSSNTKLIGQGKPVIAVIYEGGDSASANLKYGYKQLRGEYKDSVVFLVINIHSPNGLRFAAHTPIKAGTALYYNGEGTKQMVLKGPKDVASLRESIKTTFEL